MTTTSTGFSKNLLRSFLRSLRATKRALAPALELTEMPLVKQTLAFLVRQAKSDFVADVQGHQMYVGKDDNLNLSAYGMYEFCETRFFQKMIKPGQVVVDIGANIGYYTLQFARAVGNTGYVFAFEPEAENFALLQRNVQLNGYQNVTLVRKAVSDRTGTLRFYVSDNAAAHSVSDSHGATEFIDAECTTLDEYFAGRKQRVDVIKMDVEGAEFHAVNGMRGVLRDNTDLMLVTEFWPKGLSHASTDPRAYLQLLTDLGFDTYYLNETREQLERGVVDRLLSEFTVDNGHHCNLVFSRRGLTVDV